MDEGIVFKTCEHSFPKNILRNIFLLKVQNIILSPAYYILQTRKWLEPLVRRLRKINLFQLLRLNFFCNNSQNSIFYTEWLTLTTCGGSVYRELVKKTRIPLTLSLKDVKLMQLKSKIAAKFFDELVFYGSCPWKREKNCTRYAIRIYIWIIPIKSRNIEWENNLGTWTKYNLSTYKVPRQITSQLWNKINCCMISHLIYKRQPME